MCSCCARTRVCWDLFLLVTHCPSATGRGWCHKPLSGPAVSQRALGQAGDGASACCPVACSLFTLGRESEWSRRQGQEVSRQLSLQEGLDCSWHEGTSGTTGGPEPVWEEVAAARENHSRLCRHRHLERVCAGLSSGASVIHGHQCPLQTVTCSFGRHGQLLIPSGPQQVFWGEKPVRAGPGGQGSLGLRGSMPRGLL